MECLSDDDIHKAAQASEDSAHHDLDSDAAQQIEKHYKQIMKKKRGEYIALNMCVKWVKFGYFKWRVLQCKLYCTQERIHNL